MSIKVTVAVLSSVALGAVGIGGGFLYDRLTKSEGESGSSGGDSRDGLESGDSPQKPSEASGVSADKSSNHREGKRRKGRGKQRAKGKGSKQDLRRGGLSRVAV